MKKGPKSPDNPFKLILGGKTDSVKISEKGISDEILNVSGKTHESFEKVEDFPDRLLEQAIIYHLERADLEIKLENSILKKIEKVLVKDGHLESIADNDGLLFYTSIWLEYFRKAITRSEIIKRINEDTRFKSRHCDVEQFKKTIKRINADRMIPKIISIKSKDDVDDPFYAICVADEAIDLKYVRILRHYSS